MEQQLNELFSDLNAVSATVMKTKHIVSLHDDSANSDEIKDAYKKIISELQQTINEKIEALYEKYSK